MSQTDTKDVDTDDEQRRRSVPLGKLRGNDYNPRGEIEDVSGLRDSIEEDGLIQSLLVRPINDGEEFEVIAGMRRLVALGQLYDDDYPVSVEVRDVDDQTAARLAMKENLERKNLSPMEEARGFAQQVEVEWCPECGTIVQNGHSAKNNHETVIKTFLDVVTENVLMSFPSDGHPSVEEVSQSYGGAHRTSTRFISERLSLLLLTDRGRELIDDKDISIRAGRMMVRKTMRNDEIEDAETAHEAMEQVINKILLQFAKHDPESDDEEGWPGGIPGDAYTKDESNPDEPTVEKFIEDAIDDVLGNSDGSPTINPVATDEQFEDRDDYNPFETDATEAVTGSKTETETETESGSEPERPDLDLGSTSVGDGPSGDEQEDTESDLWEDDEWAVGAGTDDVSVSEPAPSPLRVTVVVEGVLREQLEALAQERGVPVDEVAHDAISTYVANQRGN